MSIASRTIATCALFLLTAALAWSQSSVSTAPEPGTDTGTVPAAPANPADKEPAYYLELGGSYSILDRGAPAWKEFSLRFGYTGKKRFTPFVTISTQNRGAGSQQNYGAYSYLTLNKRLIAIVGASGAPGQNPILYPKLRTGGTLLMGIIPKVPGLFLSTGYSDLRFPGGSGGGIGSLGAIYYGKVVLSASVNFNHSWPGGFNSQSAQAGFQYGHQGKYYIGAGVGGGDAAYALIGLVPLNVKFNSLSANVFYQKWLTRRFGLICRYDYLNEVAFFQKHGVYLGAFFGF